MTKVMTAKETVFSIHAPPHVGHYKLEIFAAAVPKTKGKLNLPIVATFMVEVRLKSSESVDKASTHKDVNKHKLALIAEAFDVPSEVGSSGVMYPDTVPSYGDDKRLESAGSIFTSKEQIQPFSGKKRKSHESSDSRRTSAFSISSFLSRKFS